MIPKLLAGAVVAVVVLLPWTAADAPTLPADGPVRIVTTGRP